MPYESNDDLPGSVKNVMTDRHALDIYKKAFNAAWKQYQDPKKKKGTGDDIETICHKVAWSAVKEKYYKNDEDGCWYRKDE
jgi:cation transport regulator